MIKYLKFRGVNTREISDKEAWFLAYNEKINEQKEILSSPDYMLWLIDYTDKKQVEKLALLYEIIESYANENFIYPKIRDISYYFRLKYEDIGYKIGVINN
ncbi:MAG TPA: hypothetical protein IAB45_01350 [Candidatus Onthousia faecavium]|nr:hypothetical protein [Candidatus Onthousia faecavium]